MKIHTHPCTNWTHRRRRRIDFVVCHQTAATTFESTRSWFMNPESKRSAHYVIDKDGTIHNFVPEKHAAWHCRNWNSASIGVEFVGLREPMTPAQEDAAAVLFARFRREYPAIRFTEHREMPGAKTECPSKLFEKWGGVRKFLDSIFESRVEASSEGGTHETAHDPSHSGTRKT